jgi:putative RecB family exonuclease
VSGRSTNLRIVSTEVATAEVEAPPRPPALSPSRAVDFRRCALLYRFRAVDRLPETPSPGALRGTLVHAVLERLHGLAPDERRPAAARDLARTVLDELDPAERAPLGADPAPRLDALLDAYFALEDPRSVTSEGLELRVEADLDAGDAAERSSTRGCGTAGPAASTPGRAGPTGR